MTNVKPAGSLKTPKSSAGWESDNFNILLAGCEKWVFFLGKFSLKILNKIDVAALE